MKRFKKICKKTQKELIPYLVAVLSNYGYSDVVQECGYIYAKGDIPILLTAHTDTVHKATARDIVTVCENGTYRLSSPQGIGGDDRCGVYAILEIIKTHKPYILFCEDEEIGCIGSLSFCNSVHIKDLTKMKYLIGLDRANANDAVFYQCDNTDFTQFIIKHTGYKMAYGSFSDISKLAPKCEVAAVNLSCGYHNAHTLIEYVVWEELQNTIRVVKNLLDTECEQFKYIAKQYSYHPYFSKQYKYDSSQYNFNKTPRTSYNEYTTRMYNEYSYDYVLLEVQYPSALKDEDTKTVYVQALTKDAAWGKFFFDHPNVCFNDILDYSWDYI